MKPTRLILIPGLGSEPAPYLVIVDGMVRERGLLELHPVERPEPMRTVAIVPGAEVTMRWLDLPVGGMAQQRAAALWMLKDSLAVQPERLATALGPIPTAGRPRLIALVGLPLLQTWVDYMEALGVRADAIVPDVLTVPEPDGDDRLNAVVFGQATALRGRGFAASVQPDLVELVAGSRPVEPIMDAAEVERALIEAALEPPVNLLTSPDRSAARRGWALASALAGLLVVSPLVLIAAAAARDDASARADGERARAEIARVAPDLAARPDPVEAMRQRVRAAPPPGGVVSATAALFAAVEGVEGAELDLLIVDPAAGMKASVTHADYQDTQAIARAMRANGLEVTETAAINDRGRIVSDITIGSAR
jgi:general secretion pathway protein L